MLLGVLILGGVAAGIFAWQGAFTTEVMDHAHVEDGATSVLEDEEDGFGLSGVTSVSCPRDQEVTVNATFTCTATIDGEERDVPITIENNNADYVVGQPE